MFLTTAGVIDPRMKRVDPVEQADMATAWARVLADVSLEDALAALEQHYRQSRDAIMPADVLALLRIDVSSVSVIPDRTAEVLAESRRAQLEAAGLTEADVAEHSHDPAWLAARFPARELTPVPTDWPVPLEEGDDD